MLYQLSYRGIVATRTRLELVTSAVTGRHSNQLNHRATHKKMVGANGIEPLTFCFAHMVIDRGLEPRTH